MPHHAFLVSATSYLSSASLTPSPVSIGDVEPSASAELPAVVLSLEEVRRAGSGLGQRTVTVENGHLPWQARIDLAHPVLLEDPDFTLLSGDRLRLILPHGGLVRHDGSTGSLGSDDLVVTVGGINRPVVNGVPSGDEVLVDPLIGQLTFATPLPATGMVQAEYFVGIWEQQVVRISGVVRVDVLATEVNEVRALTGSVIDALMDNRAKEMIQKLIMVDVSSIGSIGVPEPDAAQARRRAVRFAFTFEHEINRPESSGGIIREVPAVAHLEVMAIGKN